MNEIAIKYHNIYHETTLENTITFFNQYSKNILSSKNKRMSVIFLKLSDETFNKIKNNPLDMIDKNFMAFCYMENGNNIHLTKAFGKGFKEFREIIKELKSKYNPKTLTWFRDDISKLHSIKGE